MKVLLTIFTMLIIAACGVAPNEFPANPVLVTAETANGETLVAVANQTPTADEMGTFIQNTNWQNASSVIADQNNNDQMPFELVAASTPTASGDCPSGQVRINGTCYVVQHKDGQPASPTAIAQTPVQVQAPELDYQGQSLTSTQRQGTRSEQVVRDEYRQDVYTHQIQPVVRRIQLPDRHVFQVLSPTVQDIDLRGQSQSVVYFNNQQRPLNIPQYPTVQIQTCDNCVSFTSSSEPVVVGVQVGCRFQFFN